MATTGIGSQPRPYAAHDGAAQVTTLPELSMLEPSGPGAARPRELSGGRHRQWGSDRRTRALPMTPRPASDGRVAMGRLAVVVTIGAWLAYVITWCFSDFFHRGNEGAVARTEAVLYLVIVTLLTVFALAYLLSRLGVVYRTRSHHLATRARLEQY